MRTLPLISPLITDEIAAGMFAQEGLLGLKKGKLNIIQDLDRRIARAYVK